MRLDKYAIRYLTILSLLKKEPMIFVELWKSGCFKKENHLKWALDDLLDHCLIDRLGSPDCIVYVINGMGLKYLEAYPNFDLRIVLARAEMNRVIQRVEVS